MSTRTLDVFNSGLELKVVRVDADRLGVIDDSKHCVWIESEFRPERRTCPELAAMPRVAIPRIPEHYGQWETKAIGGVSGTERRKNVLRALDGSASVPLFAVRAPSTTAVHEAFEGLQHVAVVGQCGDGGDEFGIVSEITVHASVDVAYAAAIIARSGATPIFENASQSARRCIGIERLDRIGARVVTDDKTMVDGDDGMYGLRRGSDNWRFGWIPDVWEHPPITWDHMARNLRYVTDLSVLPHPIQRHVAEYRLRTRQHAPIGSHWQVTNEGGLRFLQADKKVADDADPGLAEALGRGVREFDGMDLPHAHVVVRGTDGRLYCPIDTRKDLSNRTSGKRWVSAALTKAQSRQLINAFYTFDVERCADPEARRACALILYRYMIERGYTARWMGKYDQDAMHVGNGDGRRKFHRLPQYHMHALPTDVLNRLYARDGKLQCRGSKGSRSKYIQKKKKRYQPKRRMQRSDHDEQLMMKEL